MGAALTKLLAPTDPLSPASATAAGFGLDSRTSDLSRLSRRVFRERLCGVVSELRGLMRVR